MLLSLKDISKGFGEPGNRSRRPVLDGVSLEVEEGERIAILGPSGSGKTTLLNLIGGLDHPDSGSLVFRDREITSFSPREMDAYRNRNIGFVFQFHHLLPQCTLLENVLIAHTCERESTGGKLREGPDTDEQGRDLGLPGQTARKTLGR